MVIKYSKSDRQADDSNCWEVSKFGTYVPADV